MAYTVKQVAGLSGVSVRTLHFYDEEGLLKPAYTGANGYRFYEEPQLLTLQQILFYRELGFELRQIRELLGRADFQRVDALRAHREALEERLARSRRLLETIDHTIDHLEGRKPMNDEQIFAGFTVGAGDDRFGERVRLAGEPNDCKVAAADTGGAMSVFEFRGRNGWPRHSHHEQDEWLYVVDGEIACDVGDRRLRLHRGESVFVPRTVAHAWASRGEEPATVLEVYQPAGRLEQFFRELGRFTDPPVHEALSIDEMKQLFDAHGMRLLGPGLGYTD
ncbi:MAG TPA: MerR family transcriptional regulator [Longimicrobium sp.]|jgi:DNA-binding transcriptional MerR regulator/quercetin dioxygenase-like cupin family protein